MKLLLAITGLALPLAANAAAAETLASTFARMDRAALGFKSMSARMRRATHLEVIKEDNTDTGTIVLKRSRPRGIRMLVQLTEPDPKSVSVQGKKAEMYFPKMKTVQEWDLGKYRDLMEQFFLLGFGSTSKELESGYRIRMLGPDAVNGQKTIRLELIPKSNEVLQHLKKVELWISDTTGYPVQQKFFQAGGDYTLVTYSDFKVNPDVPDSALKLQVPKGVKREYPQKQ